MTNDVREKVSLKEKRSCSEKPAFVIKESLGLMAVIKMSLKVYSELRSLKGRVKCATSAFASYN